MSVGLSCNESCLYCRFRPGCVIWELCRQEARKRCREVENPTKYPAKT